jgi:hypothetical protein
MMLLRKTNLTCLLIALPLVASSALLPDAKLTLRVLDETGQIVSNATVKVVFEQGGDAMEGKYDQEILEGPTDTDGLFVAQARTLGLVRISVGKDGYYPTSQSMQVGTQGSSMGRWQPWNSVVELTLKERVRPVPMFARRVREEFPLDAETVSYDCEKGDFVAPHGSGTTPDLIFHFEGSLQDWKHRDENLTITFTNKRDGIQEVVADRNQGSALLLPHAAPADGYQARMQFGKSRTAREIQRSGIREGQNFIFRVRTELDEEGNIVRANYGKVHGPLEFGFASEDKWILIFSSYLNPEPNDQSIEFDLGKNLLKGLSSLEVVREP